MGVRSCTEASAFASLVTRSARGVSAHSHLEHSSDNHDLTSPSQYAYRGAWTGELPDRGTSMAGSSFARSSPAGQSGVWSRGLVAQVIGVSFCSQADMVTPANAAIMHVTAVTQGCPPVYQGFTQLVLMPSLAHSQLKLFVSWSMAAAEAHLFRMIWPDRHVLRHAVWLCFVCSLMKDMMDMMLRVQAAQMIMHRRDRVQAWGLRHQARNL